MISIPNYVFEVAAFLEKNGYEAYLVGGSLRDILLNTEPHDFDIATNAVPDEVIKLFPQSIPTGAKFGTILVLVHDEKTGETHEVEVTTYRSEKDYVGGRWPSHVEFSTKIIDDLKRRDFTVNAMALHLNNELKIKNNELVQHEVEDLHHLFVEHLRGLLIDPFCGEKDLEQKVIRAVGDPVERFTEDGLRPMRACRLASVLDFSIEENTFSAITETLEVAALISKERVHDELVKLIKQSPKPSKGIELMRKSGLLKLYIPELLEGFGMEQNQYHVHDVYQHLLDTMDIAPKEVRIAALLHDIGKARTKDGEHFYSHDQVGAEMTREILTRLKFSRKFVEDTANLVRWHMFFLPEKPQKNTDVDTSSHEYHQGLRDNRNQAFKQGWSDSAIRRLIRNVGGHEQVDNLIKLRIADATANPKRTFDPEEVRVLAERVAAIREQDSLLSTKDLKINGHDLMEIGIHGEKIKEVMEFLLEEVTEDITLNEKEILLQMAKDYRAKQG